MKYNRNGYNRLLAGSFYSLEFGIFEGNAEFKCQPIAKILKGD